MTLEEELQIAYNDENNVNHPIESIYIKTHEVNVLTDGESRATTSKSINKKEKSRIVGHLATW